MPQFFLCHLLPRAENLHAQPPPLPPPPASPSVILIELTYFLICPVFSARRLPAASSWLIQLVGKERAHSSPPLVWLYAKNP